MLGISMSRVTTCGFTCGIRASAIRPSGAEPTTSMSGSSPRTCVTSRRMTTESSTTRARILLPAGISFLDTAGKGRLLAHDPEQPELVFDGLVGKRLDHVFIRPGLQRGRNLFRLRLGSNHHDGNRGKLWIGAQVLDKLEPVHLGHVPVHQEQRNWGAVAVNLIECFSAVPRLRDLKAETFERSAKNHPHRA